MLRLALLLLMTFSLLLAKELTLGVVPQQSPLKLLKVWKPVASYLSKATGLTITFKTEKSIPLFSKKLYQGHYDLAYVNPIHFVLAHDKAGYDARVRAEKNIVGIMIAAKGKSLQSLLASDPTFLFPAPNAFAATLLVKYELLTKFGVDVEKKKFRYVNSHDSVYKGIARGIGEIGGGIIRTFKAFNDQKSKEKISIIYKTKAYPSHPFVFHPRVPKQIQEKLIQALISMPEELKQALKLKKMISIDNDEYKNVKNLAKKLKL